MKKFFVLVLCISVKIADAQCRLGQPHPYAIQDVSAICSALGVGYINVYKPAGNFCGQYQNNATSTHDAYGQPIIVYDPNWFEEIYLTFGRAANISILAHEIGHHVQNHSSFRMQFVNQWQKELEADFISGFAMARLGYSLEDALMPMRNLNRGCSFSHPCTSNRLQAIKNGWYYAINN